MGLLDKFTNKWKKEPTKKGRVEGKSDKKGTDEVVSAEKVIDQKPVTRGPLAKEGATDAYRILLQPLFTEKSDRLQAQAKYSFLVALHASKVEILRAVRELYGVKPTSVRVIKIHGKNVHFGRTSGKEKDQKKAIITLKQGETLTVLTGV